MPSICDLPLDHPRVRGEDSPCPSGPGTSAGSPPHARGRLDGGGVLCIRGGITPACAGKTSFARVSMAFSQDHPRMRGEDVAACSSNDP